MKFGENLKLIRKQKNISQEELAEKLNVSRQSISKWENAESYPTMNNILELCKIFHVSINDLVHLDMSDINLLDEEIKMSVVKFKEDKQKKMKGLSKAIYILAKITKVLVIVAIPFVVIAMFLFLYFIKNIDVKDNKITYTGKNSSITIVEEIKNDEIYTSFKYNNILIAERVNFSELNKVKDILINNPKWLIISYVEVAFFILIVCLILYALILKHLENLFINIYKGSTPFTLENVTHIKKIALLMIIVLLLPSIIGALFELIMNIDLDIELSVFNIIEVLFLFSISYIFEYGYQIQLDSKGVMYDKK